MPELPEVETIVRDLRRELVGQRIVGGELIRPSLVRTQPEVFMDSAVGRCIERVERRGKYIRLKLEEGMVLLVHLGMSGRLSLVGAGSERLKHTHAAWRLSDGRELRYSDPRRFGRLGIGTDAELEATGVLPKLGPEAISEDFSLHERLKGRKTALKSALLDQRVLAGVGNIYADEALWQARLRPDREAGKLSHPQARRLQAAIKEVLEEGITNRGSTIEGYRDAWGRKGRQQEKLAAYGRQGQPCWRCAKPLQGKRIGGRSSTWCAHCQR